MTFQDAVSFGCRVRKNRDLNCYETVFRGAIVGRHTYLSDAIDQAKRAAQNGSPRVSAEPITVYSRGRGGVDWPEERYAAKVDGQTLLRKDGVPRRFQTFGAAIAAALKEIGEDT